MRSAAFIQFLKLQAERFAKTAPPVASLLLAAGGFLLVLSPCFASQPQASTPQQTVVIKQMQFQPHTLDVKPGERVVWKNEDIFTHTVTASDGSFDSGPIAPGSSWQTIIRKTGTIAYHCRPHPNMTAELISVNSAAQQQHEPSEEAGPSLRWSLPDKPEEFHPILVNFTAALLPLALLSDLLGRVFRRQALQAAGLWMMLYEAVITPLTAAAGWWWKHAEANELPAKLITVHQWLGTAAAAAFIALAIWRWSFHRRAIAPSWAYLAFTLVAVLALVYQGSLGGGMVFGH